MAHSRHSAGREGPPGARSKSHNDACLCLSIREESTVGAHTLAKPVKAALLKLSLGSDKERERRRPGHCRGCRRLERVRGSLYLAQGTFQEGGKILIPNLDDDMQPVHTTEKSLNCVL